jgi:IMP dehydrogenase
MSTVVNADFCIQLYKAGALGIMHRALDETPYLAEVQEIASKCSLVAASVGVGDGQFELAQKLIQHGANIITIDIAHGYCDAVIDLGKRIKQYSPSTKLILGNTINSDMIYEVSEFADAIKIGIAQGAACETKDTAGCTAKQFSAIRSCVFASKQCGIPIISDGGIRKPSDFTKAIMAGANSVMAGSIFARCPESAGEIVNVDGIDKKIYAGMASRQVQNQWRGGLTKGTCPEGKTIYMDIGEPLSKLLERYSGALRSGITYVGELNINDAQRHVKFLRIMS